MRLALQGAQHAAIFRVIPLHYVSRELAFLIGAFYRCDLCFFQHGYIRKGRRRGRSEWFVLALNAKCVLNASMRVAIAGGGR